MNSDQASDKMEMPLGSVEQPKSGGKKWLIGGCGCLTLLAIVCIGGGAFVWMQVGKPFYDFLNENVVFIQDSEVVQDSLGTPIETGAPQTSSSTENGVASIELRIPASGPKANGTVVLKGKYEEGVWVREDLYLEIEGERIELDPDAAFQLNIDDGN